MNHSHVLYDADPHFSIDPISRKITNQSSTKTIIIQHDHNSERFTFEMPRFVEGHDMSECNVVEIHYVNVEANTKLVKAGVYSVDDLQVKENDDATVVCSWLVPNNATQLVGQLQFLIRFSCVSDVTGNVEYVWNTSVYSGIMVSSGIYNGDSPSDNPVPAFNFVTTIDGTVLKFFVGTQAQYDALSADDKEGLFAIISDDTTKEELFEKLEDLVTWKQGLIEGTSAVSMATNATHANTATYATNAERARQAETASNATQADAASVAYKLNRPWFEKYVDFNVDGDIKPNQTGLYVFWLYVGDNTVNGGSTSLHTVMMNYNVVAANEQSTQFAGTISGNYKILIGVHPNGTLYTQASTFPNGAPCESAIMGYMKIC